MKFLIDECLHTSLVQVAHAAGYAADHVNFLSLEGLKDWQLLPVIRERDFAFVTNNGPDFLALLGNDDAATNGKRSDHRDNPVHVSRAGGGQGGRCSL